MFGPFLPFRSETISTIMFALLTPCSSISDGNGEDRSVRGFQERLVRQDVIPSGGKWRVIFE